MSQMPASARLAPRAPRRIEPRRPHLSVVPAPAPGPRRLPFVVLCSFLLAGGLLLLLVLNVGLAQGAYEWHELTDESQLLREQQQSLETQVRHDRAPDVLAERARELGMVGGVPPAFLRLPDGQVLGIPQAAAPSASPGASGDPTDSTASTDATDSPSSGSGTSSGSSSAGASPTAGSSKTGSSPSSSSTPQSSSRPTSTDAPTAAPR